MSATPFRFVWIGKRVLSSPGGVFGIWCLTADAMQSSKSVAVASFASTPKDALSSDPLNRDLMSR